MSPDTRSSRSTPVLPTSGPRARDGSARSTRSGRRRRTPLAALVLAALVLLSLAACTGSSTPQFEQPPVSAFAEGTCRVAAPEVLALGRDARGLGQGPGVPADLLARLGDEQGRLSTVAEGAEPAYKQVLGQLVVRAGLVRIRAVGNTYAPELGTDLSAAYDAAVRACTKGAAG